MDLEEFKGYTPVEVFSHNKFPKIKEDPYLFTIAPYGYYWFSLEKERPRIDGESKIPELKIDSWENLLKNRTLQKLSENILPPYLIHRRWFESDGRIIQEIKVKNTINLNVEKLPLRIAILEVIYNEGLPEVYQMPIAFAAIDDEDLLDDIPKRGIIAKLKIGRNEGYLFDAIYAEAYRDYLLAQFIDEKTDGKLSFRSDSRILKPEKKLRSKLVDTEHRQNIITYEDEYVLKLYRKLDITYNPDVETIKFLSQQTNFEFTSKYAGVVEFQQVSGKPYVLAMLQKKNENQGEAWELMKDSLDRYFENVLTRSKHLPVEKPEGKLTRPISYDNIPESMKDLMGVILPERIYQMGEFTSALHKALSQNPAKDFSKEESSLHYQRSLFSGLQTLTRTTLQNLKSNLDSIPEEFREEAKEVIGLRSKILECFKEIYDHKIPVMKIRTHGDFHLEQVVWTGKDFLINNFEGDSSKSFSDRRILRSAMRDLASMIRSFHYVAYSRILSEEFSQQRKEGDLEEWAEDWHYYVSRLYIKGYFDKSENADFIPEDVEDFRILMHTFLLEKALMELNYEIKNRPEWTIIPIRGITAIIRYRENLKNQN